MSPTRNQIRSLMDRPVAVFGAGVTGNAVEAFLNGMGVETVFYDERPHLSGESVNDFMAAPSHLHRLVVCSPGFSRQHEWLKAARRQGMTVIGDLDLGYLFWPGKILAVTGTNGKSTTALLLERALAHAGLDARACGNIGTPLVHLVESADPECWAVVEVSSFQCELMESFRCDAALWTNFDEDHIDRHGGLVPYFEAKARLFEMRRNSRSKAWVGPSVEETRKREDLCLKEPYEVVPVRPESVEDLDPACPFRFLPQAENFCLVSAFWKDFGFPREALVEAANELEMLPHRLEAVASEDGVTYWNDSKATNFAATLAALQRFEQKVYWIGGGRAKGGDLQRFVRELAPRIGQAFVLGETAPPLRKALVQEGVKAEVFESLESAVRTAHRVARGPGDVVFSPGFASFDDWKNYAERGDAFRRLVREHLSIKSTTLPT